MKILDEPFTSCLLFVVFPFPVGLCCPGIFSSTCGQLFYNSLFSYLVSNSLLSFLTLRRVFPWPPWCSLGQALPTSSFTCCLDALISSLFSLRLNLLPVQATSENQFFVSFCPLSTTFLPLMRKFFCLWYRCGGPCASFMIHFCLMGSSSFVGLRGFQGWEELRSD